MGKVCLKCNYERQETDNAPEYECPRCGAVYAKVEAALAELHQVDEGGAPAAGTPAAGTPAAGTPAAGAPVSVPRTAVSAPPAPAPGTAADAAARAPVKPEFISEPALPHPVDENARPLLTAENRRRLWLAGSVVLAVLLLAWLLPRLWLSQYSDELQRFQQQELLASPSVLPKPDPLQGETSPPQRRLRAAELFAEFYLFNTVIRPQYCMQEHQVSLQQFADSFRQAHRSEWREARAILGSKLDEGALLAREQERMYKQMQRDMQRLQDEMDKSGGALCSWMEVRAEHVVWRMHIVVAAPVIKSILQLQ